MRQAMYHFNGVTYTFMDFKRLLWQTVNRDGSRFGFVHLHAKFNHDTVDIIVFSSFHYSI